MGEKVLGRRDSRVSTPLGPTEGCVQRHEPWLKRTEHVEIVKEVTYCQYPPPPFRIPRGEETAAPVAWGWLPPRTPVYVPVTLRVVPVLDEQLDATFRATSVSRARSFFVADG